MNSKELSKEEVLKKQLVKYFRVSFPETISDDELYKTVRVFHEEEKAILAAMDEWAEIKASRVIGELVGWMEEMALIKKSISEDFSISVQTRLWERDKYELITKFIQKAQSLLKQEEKEKCKHCGSIWLESDGKKTQCRSCYKWWRVKQEGEDPSQKDRVKGNRQIDH